MIDRKMIDRSLPSQIFARQTVYSFLLRIDIRISRGGVRISYFLNIRTVQRDNFFYGTKDPLFLGERAVNEGGTAVVQLQRVIRIRNRSSIIKKAASMRQPPLHVCNLVPGYTHTDFAQHANRA